MWLSITMTKNQVQRCLRKALIAIKAALFQLDESRLVNQSLEIEENMGKSLNLILGT